MENLRVENLRVTLIQDKEMKVAIVANQTVVIVANRTVAIVANQTVKDPEIFLHLRKKSKAVNQEREANPARVTVLKASDL